MGLSLLADSGVEECVAAALFSKEQDALVRSQLHFVSVEHADEVLGLVFSPKETVKSPSEKRKRTRFQDAVGETVRQ